MRKLLLRIAFPKIKIQTSYQTPPQGAGDQVYKILSDKRLNYIQLTNHDNL